jgi:spermidine synthase
VVEQRVQQQVRLALWLFCLSGIAGLMYEVIWSRQLTLIFGATTLSISTVLTTYMVGLGLGSFLAGRLLNATGNPFRAYALLEAGIGVYAVLFPAALGVVNWLHSQVFPLLYASPLPLALTRFGLAFLVLLPVTILMGATVPVMGRALVRETGELGAGAGRLYAWNTLGAAVGSGLGGFLMIPVLGLRWSTLAAAALNLTIAAIAWRLTPSDESAAGTSDGVRPASPQASSAAGSLGVSDRRWLLACYGISGFAALAFEVILTRVLILVYGSSVYALAVVLTGFLLGIGLGSLAAGKRIDRTSDLAAAVGILQAVIGVSILVTSPLYDRLPDFLFRMYRATGGEWVSLTLLEFVMTVGLLLVPTAAMGAMFPLASKIAGDRRLGAGRAVADAYTVNTVGAVLGAFAGGFVLIPMVGLQKGMLALALVNLLLAAILVWRSDLWRPERRRAMALTLVALPIVGLAVLPGWDARLLNSGVYVYAPEYERLSEGGRLSDSLQRFTLLYYREGVSATVSVFRGQYLFMRVNGKTDAGDSPDNLTQRLLAHVPLLLHSAPKDVLVIGLGSGVTLGSALQHRIDRADIVEISPEVVDAARFFQEANRNALLDPRSHLMLLDGRTWLTGGPRSYDVIISEPSNPWQTGNANLFTREHFLAARARLNPGGILCQWLPYYRMPEGDFRAAIKTFQEVFPQAMLWISGSDALMIGSLEAIRPDVGRLRVRLAEEKVRLDLAEVGIPTLETFLSHALLGPDGVGRFVRGNWARHTDDWPILEFSGPKALFLETASANFRAMLREAEEPLPLANAGSPEAEGETRAALAGEYLARRLVDPALREARKAAEVSPRSAAARVVLGRALLARNEFEKSTEAFQAAVRLNPSLAEAWNDLGGALVRLDKPDEAIAAYRRAADAKYGPALYNLGIVYLRHKRDPRSARAVLEQAVGRGQVSADAWNALGVAYAQLGEYQRARDALDQALRIEPNHPEARRNRQRLDQASLPSGAPAP